MSEDQNKGPAEDGDGEGVCDDADDCNDEGGVPAQVQVDLMEQVQLLLCWFLKVPLFGDITKYLLLQ